MKIKSNRLISILLSTIMCLTVLTGAAWALTGLFEVGMSIQVTYDPLVDAKVYLSTDSNGAETEGLKQLKADYSEITAKNFVKENSALVLNTYSTNDDSGAKTKNDFQNIINGLTCNNNGEMQFYVYVENYSETESVYYRANISFNGETPESETTPFNVTENPPYAVSEAVSDSTGGG